MKKRELHLPPGVRVKRRAIKNRLMQLMGSRSQHGWARELGVPQQNISRYLRGTASPHVAFLIHLGKTETVRLNWLV